MKYGDGLEHFSHDVDVRWIYIGGLCMAVASGPAGLVLAGPVFTIIFKTAHAQIMNNE